ncbi:hypothetical protein BRD22_06285 [Halobacteriales archaeon SW_8_68_21]|nr:MAG: hypothetical protein BRD22_06285 [Halobacteriales archaeon SW_8_68_21]
MTDGNRRKQAQAVFFSVVMVLSMVGGSVAFAGSAAAATTSVELSDDLVQGGDVIDVNGTVNSNGTVHAFIDQDDDGNYTGGTDASNSVNIEDYQEDNEFSISLSAPDESETYDVYVFQDEGETDSTIDEGDESDRSAKLQVDADEPTFGNETPEDGSDVTQANGDLQITVPIEDANTSVETITATVKNNAGDINTYEINPETQAGDGVSWDGSDLVIEPGVGNVPSIADDTYNVNVSATDKVGNSNSTSFGFTVDSVAPTFNFVAPDPTLTNDENETVTVSLSPSVDRSINNSTVSLDIEGPGYSESFDYEDDEYTNNTNRFSVTPDGDEVPSLNEGEYDVTVSAEDDIGNSNSTDFDFTVDLTQITAEDVTLNESELNTMSDDPTVTVQFGEDVDASTVSAEVNIDGKTREKLSFNQPRRVPDDEAEATLNLDLDSYDNLENDSAVINVTSAQDLAGNSLANPADDGSQTEFQIDTDGPDASLNKTELSDESSLSGYVNMTAFVDSTTDAEQENLQILVGQDESAVVDLTESGNESNLKTYRLPDGTHTLRIVVEDENGNTANATANFGLDNDQPITIEQGKLPAWETRQPAGKSIDLKNVFNTSGVDSGNVDYRVSVLNDEFEVIDEDVTENTAIQAEDFRGEIVRVVAETDEFRQRAYYEFAPLEGVDVNGDTIDIGIKSSEQLDELNVTLETTDDFYEQTERSYTNFEERETADGYIYSLTAEDLRDGDYKVTVDEAVGGDVVTKATDLDDATVDAEDPSAETAYVIGSDGGGTLVRVEFSEDITLKDASTTTFRGASDAVSRVDNNGDGTLNVFLNGEVQTADAPLLNVSGVTETTGDGTSLEEDASTEVATISLDLTADGLNVISLPAEAGSVNIEETELNTDDAGGEDGLVVYAYDAAGDHFNESFSPGAQENSLTELEGGEAYVVTVEEDITVEFNVQNVPSEKLQAPQSQQITEGYNLIGHYQESRQSVGQALTYLKTDYDIERGYSGTHVSALEPGEGYWLFSNGAGVYAPVNYGGITSDQPTVGNVQVTDTTGNGVLQQDEEVEISATVQHDDVIDSVTAFLGSIAADTDSVTLTDDNNDGEYTGTLTVNFSESAEGNTTLTIPVQAVDVDGNAGFDRSGEVQTASDAGSDDPGEPKSVTNNDTGVEYNSLTAALNEAEEFQTLELSAGTFAQDRDSLTISTNNLKLVGQGENETSIRPEVRITGDSVEIEQIRFEEINPSGDVTVLGDGVVLDSVSADNTISVEGDQASVDDSNASTVDITGSDADVDNVNANDTISIEGDDASVDNSNASTVDITGSGASVSNSQATTVTVNGSNANITDSSADTVSVESGGSDASLDVDSNETTVDDSVSDTVSVSNVTIRVSTPKNLTAAANGSKVKGINVSEADGDVTVRVAEGTYETSVTVDVEGLTLEGPNAGTPGNDTRGAEAIITGQVSAEANNTVVDGLTVSPPDPGSDTTSSEAIRVSNGADSVVIQNNIVEDFTREAGSGFFDVDGINLFGGDGNDAVESPTVQDNLVQGLSNNVSGGAAGISVQGNVANATVEQNTIENIGEEVTAYGFGVVVRGTDNTDVTPKNVQVSDNKIANVVSDPKTDFVGVGVGIEEVDTGEVSFTGNDISNTEFLVEDKTETLSLSDFADNNTLDRGALLEGANVPGDTVNVISDSIQAAESSAESGDTIEVLSGTYEESVTVETENLTLEGPNAGLAGDSSERGDEALINRTSTPGSGGSAVSITAAGVTVDGFQIESDAQDGIAVNQPVDNVTIQNNRITSVTGNTFGGGSDKRATANGIAFGLSRSVAETTVTGLEVSDNAISGVTTDDLADGEDRTTANGVQVLTRQHNVEGMEITGNVISDLEPGASGGGDKRSRGIVVNVGNDSSNIGAADGFTIADNDVSDLTGAGGFSDAAGIALFEAGKAADDNTDRIGPKNFTVANNQLDNLTNTGKDSAPAIFVGGIQTLGDSHSVTGNTINDGIVIRLAEGSQDGFNRTTADPLNASGNTFTDENADAYYSDATDKADLDAVSTNNNFPVDVRVDGTLIVPDDGQNGASSN